MFHISRALYRELAGDVAPPSARAQVLRSCEAAVHRLVTDRHYFADPTRKLFDEIRWCFPLGVQPRVLRVIDRHISATRTYLESSTAATVELGGIRPRCRASTRRGKACGAEPHPRTGYCTWHRHLADEELALSA